jgi:23S rRNA pseudouridine1911/1915/1917 synthase
MEPAVLFEDNHCLALAKPAPLLTQSASPNVPSLESWAKGYLRTKYGKPGNVYLGVPHRIDRPVSGVVLFARNSKAAARLAEQFQRHQIEKTYWTIVDGIVESPEGVWEDFLHKLPDESRVEVVPAGTVGAKSAVVNYRVLQQGTGGTLLDLRPITGRSHQLRVQAAARGLPIRGDVLYGSAMPFGPQGELPRDRVIALHARSLTFLHPISYEAVTFTAALPPYWTESLPTPGQLAS